jgi:hypothetical protein
MDAEAGKYESKHSRRERPGSGTSMVEVLFKEHNPNDSNSKTRRGSYLQWLTFAGANGNPNQHPQQRRQQWDRMSSWEKLVDISRRFLVPLLLFAIMMVIILITVLVNYGMDQSVPATPDATSPMTLPPGVPDGNIAEDQAEAMTIYLTQRGLVSSAELKDPQSAPSKALDWIQQDVIALAGLPSGGTGRRQLASTAKDQLVQRYVLAVLYYTWMPASSSTSLGSAAAAALESMNLKPGSGNANSATPHSTQGWLTATSECHWIGVICKDAVKTNQMGVPTTVEAHDQNLMANEGFVSKLNLTNHELTGTLPTILAALQHLIALDLSHNQLEGDLGSTIEWTKFSQLEHLLLSNNQFTGKVPQQWESLGRVVKVDVSNNKLAGPLPNFNDGDRKMEDLEYLYLNGNALTGTIPASFLLDMPHLENVDMSDNKFTGSLPNNVIANMQKLRHFEARNNQLTGLLPSTVSDLMGEQLCFVCLLRAVLNFFHP